MLDGSIAGVVAPAALAGVLLLLRRFVGYRPRRIEAESRLRESEQKYRLLFENNPNPMWVFDDETFRFLAVNQAAIRHYGYSREEFLSMDITAIRPKEDIEDLRRNIIARARGVPPERTLWRHLKRNGDLIQVEIIHENIVFDGRKAALVSIQDVTERLRAEAATQQAHETLKAILDASPLVILAHDLNGAVRFSNAAATQQLGWSPEELLCLPPKFIRDEDIPQFQEMFGRMAKGECVRGLEWMARCKDGSLIPYSIWTAPLRDSRGEIVGVISEAVDLRERKLSEALEQDRNRVLELVATNRPSEEVLRSVERMVERQFPGRRCSVTIEDASEAPTVTEGLLAPIHSFTGQKIGDVKLLGPELSGGESDASLTGLLNLASRLSTIGIEHERILDRLAFDARHDSLTGLPNRLAFEETLREQMAGAREHNRRLAVLFLDLDRFKQINDTLGHPVGDRYLEQVSKRLSEQLSGSALLSRLGGDEFVMVIPDVGGSNAAELAASRMLAVFDQPIRVAGHDLFGGASIGISIFPDDAWDAETLQQHADSAMYCAKSSGRNRWHTFTPEMSRMAREGMEMERGLHRALEEDRFVVYYQPKYRRGGELAGAEALVRYRDPDKGLILPGSFIPKAEETGLIVPIGAWVLREVCRQSVEWQHSGLNPLRVAVNVSALQFARADFADSVAGILNHSHICPELVELELTESALMDSSEKSLRQMLRLRALGVRLSIDDFGTGFSSLSYLHRLPIDQLKIDRSFIQGLGNPHSTLPLVEAILAVGRSMGLDVVAEGVETITQLALLRDLGCPTMQGFYLGRPISASEFEKLLRAEAYLEPVELEPMGV